MLKINRRTFLNVTAGASMIIANYGKTNTLNKIPIILATDIGDDIDDTWALMMLLRMSQFDVKLIITDFGNAIYRCRLLAKLLEITQNTHIPIGIGNNATNQPGQQSKWLGNYNLDTYPGKIYQDGTKALIETISDSIEPITLLSIGPTPTIAKALKYAPKIANNARFVGMHGSIFNGYDGTNTPVAEWNVKVDPKSLQTVFKAPWEITITPLDTCGLVTLDGLHYQKLYQSKDAWLKTLIENYSSWLPAPWNEDINQFKTKSSTLFDTVAVQLAASEDLFKMKTLPLRITDDGFTIIDEINGRPVRCAIEWKDLNAFKEKLVKILLN